MADRMGFKAVMDIRKETIQKQFEVKMGLADKQNVGASELKMIVILLHGIFLIQNR
jgi:hypothetical protein